MSMLKEEKCTPRGVCCSRRVWCSLMFRQVFLFLIPLALLTYFAVYLKLITKEEVNISTRRIALMAEEAAFQNINTFFESVVRWPEVVNNLIAFGVYTELADLAAFSRFVIPLLDTDPAVLGAILTQSDGATVFGLRTLQSTLASAASKDKDGSDNPVIVSFDLDPTATTTTYTNYHKTGNGSASAAAATARRWWWWNASRKVRRHYLPSRSFDGGGVSADHRWSLWRPVVETSTAADDSDVGGNSSSAPITEQVWFQTMVRLANESSFSSSGVGVGMTWFAPSELPADTDDDAHLLSVAIPAVLLGKNNTSLKKGNSNSNSAVVAFRASMSFSDIEASLSEVGAQQEQVQEDVIIVNGGGTVMAASSNCSSTCGTSSAGQQIAASDTSLSDVIAADAALGGICARKAEACRLLRGSCPGWRIRVTLTDATTTTTNADSVTNTTSPSADAAAAAHRRVLRFLTGKTLLLLELSAGATGGDWSDPVDAPHTERALAPTIILLHNLRNRNDHPRMAGDVPRVFAASFYGRILYSFSFPPMDAPESTATVLDVAVRAEGPTNGTRKLSVSPASGVTWADISGQPDSSDGHVVQLPQGIISTVAPDWFSRNVSATSGAAGATSSSASRPFEGPFRLVESTAVGASAVIALPFCMNWGIQREPVSSSPTGTAAATSPMYVCARVLVSLQAAADVLQELNLDGGRGLAALVDVAGRLILTDDENNNGDRGSAVGDDAPLTLWEDPRTSHLVPSRGEFLMLVLHGVIKSNSNPTPTTASANGAASSSYTILRPLTSVGGLYLFLHVDSSIDTLNQSKASFNTVTVLDGLFIALVLLFALSAAYSLYTSVKVRNVARLLEATAEMDDGYNLAAFQETKSWNFDIRSMAHSALEMYLDMLQRKQWIGDSVSSSWNTKAVNTRSSASTLAGSSGSGGSCTGATGMMVMSGMRAHRQLEIVHGSDHAFLGVRLPTEWWADGGRHALEAIHTHVRQFHGLLVHPSAYAQPETDFVVVAVWPSDSIGEAGACACLIAAMVKPHHTAAAFLSGDDDNGVEMEEMPSSGANSRRPVVALTRGRLSCGHVGSVARKKFVVFGPARTMAERLLALHDRVAPRHLLQQLSDDERNQRDEGSCHPFALLVSEGLLLRSEGGGSAAPDVLLPREPLSQRVCIGVITKRDFAAGVTTGGTDAERVLLVTAGGGGGSSGGGAELTLFCGCIDAIVHGRFHEATELLLRRQEASTDGDAFPWNVLRQCADRRDASRLTVSRLTL